MLVVVFLALRVLLLTVLTQLTGGREVSSDISYLSMIVQNPLGSLLGRAPFEVASYPPLMSFILYPLMKLNLLWAGDFVAWRLTLLTIEFINFYLFWQILIHYTAKVKLSTQTDKSGMVPLGVVGLFFVIAPFQLLSSVVFVQDEIIAQFFVLLTIYALIRTNRLAAILALSVGVAVGKVFLVIPLFYVFWFFRFRVDWRDFAVASVFVWVTGWTVLVAHLAEGNVPFVGFSPSAKYASTFWVLGIKHFGLDSETLKPVSLALSLAAQLALIVYALCYWRTLNSVNGAILLVGVSLTAFFLTFYQHNPEYTLLLAPVVLLYVRTYRSVIAAVAVLSLSWLPNIFFGLNNVLTHNGSASSARRDIMGDWLTRLNLDFSVAHSVSIALYSVLYALLLLYLISCLRQAARPAAQPADV